MNRTPHRKGSDRKGSAIEPSGCPTAEHPDKFAERPNFYQNRPFSA